MEESEPKPQTQPIIDAIPPDKEPSQKSGQPPAGGSPPFNRQVVATEEHHNEPHHCRPDQTPIMKIVLEVIAVGVGCSYTLAAIMQLGVMRGTLEQMKQSSAEATNQVWQAIGNVNWMARSMDGSQKQAQQAMETGDRRSLEALNLGIRASKLEERPWFGISDFKVLQYEPDDPKKPFRFQISFRNSGKTPARQITTAAMFAAYPPNSLGPTDSDWKALLDLFSKSKERYVAAPDATRNIIVDTSMAPLSSEFMAQNNFAIKQHTSFFYYFGQITYLDIDDKVRTTKFCLVLAQPETKQFAHCIKGNDMN